MVPKPNRLLSPLERTQKVLDVSATERGTYRTCRRKWELQVLENLTPRVPPSFELEFGQGIHEALEAYYVIKHNLPAYPDTPEHRIWPLEAALDAWDTWYENTDRRFATDQTLDEVTKDQILDYLVELADLGEAMLEGYHQYAKLEDQFTIHAVEGLVTGAGKSWLNKHRAEREFFSEVAVENGVIYDEGTRRLLVPILDPKTQMPLKRRPMLSMKIDLLVHRIDPGMKGLWIYDHKTTTSVPNDRGLDFDDQLTAYCYGIWRWLGIIPRGAILNYLVKKAPKEPRVLKAGGLSAAKDQLTTATRYKKELRRRGLMLKDGTIEDHKYRDAYEALLSRGWTPFFDRQAVGRNRQELMSFEARLADEYEDMFDSYMGDLSLYPNFDKRWCPSCRVNSICQAIEDGSDVEGIIESRFEQAPDRKALRLER